MKKFRNQRKRRTKTAPSIKNLCSGPAKFCQAFNLSKKQNGIDLAKSKELWIENRGAEISPEQIVKAKRIGVDYAGKSKDKLWRFYVKDSAFVSKK